MLTNKKHNFIILFLLLSSLLTGCTSPPSETISGQKWQEDWLMIGTGIGIDAPGSLTLLDNKEALAADGLYYAAWGTGSSSPYENSEGSMTDLYDAQLYLLVNEADTEDNAEKNCQTWLASAEDNYEVLTKDTATYNGQSYTIITYNCIGEDTPYDHGVSALGVCGETAVCAELTCVENYNEDLTQLLTEFLNGCHYRAG